MLSPKPFHIWLIVVKCYLNMTNTTKELKNKTVLSLKQYCVLLCGP